MSTVVFLGRSYIFVQSKSSGSVNRLLKYLWAVGLHSIFPKSKLYKNFSLNLKIWWTVWFITIWCSYNASPCVFSEYFKRVVFQLLGIALQSCIYLKWSVLARGNSSFSSFQGFSFFSSKGFPIKFNLLLLHWGKNTVLLSMVMNLLYNSCWLAIHDAAFKSELKVKDHCWNKRL